jgi:hypothetical protein
MSRSGVRFPSPAPIIVADQRRFLGRELMFDAQLFRHNLAKTFSERAGRSHRCSLTMSCTRQEGGGMTETASSKREAKP